MTERERLIELLKELSYQCYNMECEDCVYNKEYDCKEKIRADYLLANGVIVPPLKLGQICFSLHPYRNEVDECRVSSITQKADGTFKIRLTNLRGKWVFEITVDDIGKTVFLTREESEKALAEKQRKEDEGK